MGDPPAPHLDRQTVWGEPHCRYGRADRDLAERVPLLVLFWGDPRPYVAEAHRQETKVFIQVGSVEEATAAADAGVDTIIVQGIEAGGHVKSRTALSALVPVVVGAISITVVAARYCHWPRCGGSPQSGGPSGVHGDAVSLAPKPV